MISFEPGDAIITGYAYENATNALGVLEEGTKTQKAISAEMLCTLDNLFRHVLFSNRIFLDGCVDEKDGMSVPRDARFGASHASLRHFQASDIFHRILRFEGDGESARSNLRKTLEPINPETSPWCVITCIDRNRERTIRQELVTMDFYFIEYSIAHRGMQGFKPVFPGEHLYLGLRESRVPTLGATHNYADVAAMRVRNVVVERMKKLNALIPLGAAPLPSLPPIFVARVLYECSEGAEIVPRLLEIRESSGMVRFRNWAAECSRKLRSENLAEKQRALEAYEQLLRFPGKDLAVTDFGEKVIKMTAESIKGDVLGMLSEVVGPVITFLSGLPLSMLQKLVENENLDAKNIENFLMRTFGERFSRSEMDYVSHLLQLPENVTEWKKEKAQWTVTSERLDPLAPNLSRPCFVQTRNQTDLMNAANDFEDMWNKGVPLKDFLNGKSGN